MSWNIDVPDTTYVQGDSPHDEIQRLVNEVNDAKLLAIDTETTGLSKWADIPLYWSLAWGERRATLRADTLLYFQEAFADQSKTWALANAKYDMHILANYGFNITGTWHDIQVMHALLYEDKPHKLKFVANHILGWTWADFEDSFGKIGKRYSTEELIFLAERENMDLLIGYAANDAYGTLKCWEELKRQLEGEYTYSLFSNCAPYINTLWDFFYKVEAPYTKALWKMERRGIKVDLEKFAEARPQAESKIADIEKRIVKLAGFMLNPNSTIQLRKYFFEIEGLSPLSMTKGGKTGVRSPRVDADFLKHYRHDSEMASLLLEHREYTKLYGTYIVGLSDVVDPWGRIHANFNQDVARCMPAGELVLTNRGYIPVEEVKVGDLVISHTGKPRKVTDTSKHKPQPIYKVTLSNGMKLRTTGNHQYLSGESWIRADCLKAQKHTVNTHTLLSEAWADVPDWPKYCVSSWGRVKNKQTNNVLTPQPKGEWGHLKVTLSRNGAQQWGKDKKDFGVHQLVAECFVPRALVNVEVRHRDGIVWNNVAENLEYGTSADNTEDARRHGTLNGSPVLTPAQQATVEHIEVEPPQATYGLTVEVDHSHVTGGIFTHNTGRLSSSGPNLQNIPRPENDHWNLRGAFITEPGWKMIAADYGQLEMRLLAAAAMEESMIDIFRRGWDIHSGNGALMYDVPYEDITTGKKLSKDLDGMPAHELVQAAEEKSPGITQRCGPDLAQYLRDCAQYRNDAKNIGFGLNYGMGANKLAKDLGVKREVAVAKIEKYKQTYPAVDRFMREAIEESRRTGYAFTLMGRRRNIPMIVSSRKDQRALGERLAVNTQIQGSAADVCRMAQLNLDAAGLDYHYGCHMVLQVHDELVFECPAESVEAVKPEIEELMQYPFSIELPCPMEAEAGVGDSWGDAK